MSYANFRTAGLVAALAGLAAGAGGPALERPRESDWKSLRARNRAWREITRTGKRQGERLARQKANYMLDFSASERCIERIKARIAAGAK